MYHIAESVQAKEHDVGSGKRLRLAGLLNKRELWKYGNRFDNEGGGIEQLIDIIHNIECLALHKDCNSKGCDDGDKYAEIVEPAVVGPSELAQYKVDYGKLEWNEQELHCEEVDLLWKGGARKSEYIEVPEDVSNEIKKLWAEGKAANRACGLYFANEDHSAGDHEDIAKVSEDWGSARE